MQRKSILALKREALGACRYRGHDMRPFEAGKRSAISHCRRCSNWVQVIPNPMSNEIDIGGPAVAINCPNRKGKTRKDRLSNIDERLIGKKVSRRGIM